MPEPSPDSTEPEDTDSDGSDPEPDPQRSGRSRVRRWARRARRTVTRRLPTRRPPVPPRLTEVQDRLQDVPERLQQVPEKLQQRVPDKLHGPEDEERSAGAVLYWLLRNVLLGPAVDRLFDPKAEGLQHVPERGPAILASNHLSYADWVFMPLVLDRRVTFVAKSDYFTGVGVRGWAQRRFFSGTGQVPVDRSGGRASQGALGAGLKVLRRGELFGIYPEGTRSPDGRLYKGRTGVARLALEAGVPVIPTAVIGTDVIAPPGRIVSRVISPTVRFGQPLDFSRYASMSGDRYILRSVTDEIMYAIMELSGQTYVDAYATSVKARSEQSRAAGDGMRPRPESDAD